MDDDSSSSSFVCFICTMQIYIYIVLFWAAYLTNQVCYGRLFPANGILRARLPTGTTKKLARDGPLIIGTADCGTKSVASLRGGAKSPFYLLYRKLSRSVRSVMRTYLPKSWRKSYILGSDSSKNKRYGKDKDRKPPKQSNRETTSSTSSSLKHNRLQKVSYNFDELFALHMQVRICTVTSFDSQEIQEFMTNPPDNCKLKINGNIRNWEVTLTGVKDTIYEGEVYTIKMVFPKDYPSKPPSVYFLRPCPKHVHVYTNGDICLNFLGRDWRPTMTGQMLAVSILSMLSSAKEKRIPQDNAMHADAKPGEQQHNWMYHDDRC